MLLPPGSGAGSGVCPERPAPPSLLSRGQNLARVPVLPPQEGVWEGASLTLGRDQCPEWGVVVAGGLGGPLLGQQRTFALRWLLLQECEKKEAIWVTREAAGCCPRAQPKCVGGSGLVTPTLTPRLRQS